MAEGKIPNEYILRFVCGLASIAVGISCFAYSNIHTLEAAIKDAVSEISKNTLRLEYNASLLNTLDTESRANAQKASANEIRIQNLEGCCQASQSHFGGKPQ